MNSGAFLPGLSLRTKECSWFAFRHVLCDLFLHLYIRILVFPCVSHVYIAYIAVKSQPLT